MTLISKKTQNFEFTLVKVDFTLVKIDFTIVKFDFTPDSKKLCQVIHSHSEIC